MIVEERQYQIATGKLQEFWGIYREQGLPIQIQYIGPPIGFFSVDVGVITDFVHMWIFTDYSDRERRREELHRDQRWRDYVLLSHKYIISMNTRILKVLDPGSSATPLIASAMMP